VKVKQAKIVQVDRRLDLGCVHTDTSTSMSLGFRLQLVEAYLYEWSVHGHLYKHITLRVLAILN